MRRSLFTYRLTLITLIALLVLWGGLPQLLSQNKSVLTTLIIVRAATPDALIWFSLSILISAAALFWTGWRSSTTGKWRVIRIFLPLLIIFAIEWIIIPRFWHFSSALQSAPILIRAATPTALIWFLTSASLSAVTLPFYGKTFRSTYRGHRHRVRLLALAQNHLDEAVILCDRRGQPQWSNLIGQQLLVHEGQLHQDVTRLARRVADTHRIASQSLTIQEDLRVTIQALPLDHSTIAVIARPMLKNDADQNSFYERFIRRIVHDMRNPLAAIIAHASNLYTAPTVDVETWHKTAHTIENEAQRLTRLVDSILFDARLSYIPLAAERIDLVDLLEDVLFQYDERAINEGKTIEVETPSGRAPIEGDRDLLVRAVGNLIDNSLKYSQAGSVVHLGLEIEGANYVLKVIDSGDGIPPEYLPDRIFEPLVRARPKDSGSGSGLGLSIVKKIIDLHSGSIAAHSVLDKGTTMTICLPR